MTKTTWSQPEVEALVPIATGAYRALMNDLRAHCPGREVDGFQIILALLHRCRVHDRKEDTMPELTAEQGQAVARAKRAMTYLAAAWPDVAAPLVATAAAGALVDLLQSAAGPNLVATINAQWQATPFEITRRKAN